MDNVSPIPVIPSPSENTRVRRMGIYSSPPNFDLDGQVSQPEVNSPTPSPLTLIRQLPPIPVPIPPPSPRSQTPSPPPSTSALPLQVPPPSPPVPPRSPLRPIPRSVASFATLLEHYTNRDSLPISRPLPSLPEPMPVGSIASLSALLETYHLGSTTFNPSVVGEDLVTSDDLEAHDEKSLPLLPEDDSFLIEVLRAQDSSNVSLSDQTETCPSISDMPSIDDSASILASTVTNSSTPMTKRTHALNELLASERAYASDLAFIRDAHIPLALGQQILFQMVPPLTPPGSSGSSSRTLSTASDSSSQSTLPGAPMSKEDVKIIFGNIAELAMFSDALTEKLEEAMGSVLEGGEGDDHVGALFLEIIPEMENPYKAYITRHPVALAHLNSLPRTPALTAYLTQTQSLATSITHAWDLPSLLIKPVQRLLKYSLLLATIIEETPNDHEDKANLKLARAQMEDVARRVNEGRRRLEIVKEVLTGKSDARAPNKKKMGVGKTATVSLGRMKTLNLRLSSPSSIKPTTTSKKDDEESERVAHLERRLKMCESIVQEFAKDAVQWASAVQTSVKSLRAWAAEFGSAIGLSELHRADAFDAFVAIIDQEMMPLCVGLNEIIHKELLPQLNRLLTSVAPPRRVLTAMHALQPLHESLLNLNYSKNRPPPALLESSQTFVALRGQLIAELPKFLELFEKGILVCVRQFSARQCGFYEEVRDRWCELWDALRIEGETNAGSEETLRVWWNRYREVDDMVSRLAILRRQKIFAGSTQRRSTGSANLTTSLSSPFQDVAPLPHSPSSSRSHPRSDTSSFHRHRSIGSLDSVTQISMDKRSEENLASPRGKSRPRTPDQFGRRLPRANTSPYPAFPPTSSQGRPPSPSVQSYAVEYSHDTRGRLSREPSFTRRMSDTLRGPLRRSSSQKSIRSPTADAFPLDYDRPPDIPPVPVPVPVSMLVPSTILSHITPDAPAMYSVTAIHPCEPPDGAAYLTLPFFTLQIGEVFDVVAEAGHPSTHEGLPLYVDDGEDCLLLLRGERGDIGWALASFLMPLM